MNANLSTYTPKFRSSQPSQRAVLRWDLPQLLPDVQARHDRLIEAVRRLPSKDTTLVEIRQELREIDEKVSARDWTKWRCRAYEIGLCSTCYGRGDITVHDGAGGVDFEPCPTCQWFEDDGSPYDDTPF